MSDDFCVLHGRDYMRASFGCEICDQVASLRAALTEAEATIERLREEATSLLSRGAAHAQAADRERKRADALAARVEKRQKLLDHILSLDMTAIAYAEGICDFILPEEVGGNTQEARHNEMRTGVAEYLRRVTGEFPGKLRAALSEPAAPEGGR